MSASCCQHPKPKPWYKEPLYLVGVVVLAIILMNFVLSAFEIPVLNPVVAKFFGYWQKTWWAIIVGLLIGGLIEVFAPEELMGRLLNRGKKSVLLGVLLGFLASACSHGILAIAISLYKKGASTSSTLAFLLAAPWANLAVTLLLFSLFGVKAFLIIGGALLVAVLSGFIFEFLEKRGLIEGKREISIPSNEKIVWKRLELKTALRETLKSSWVLSKTVIWWVLIGFVLASVVGTYLPEDVFHRFFGPTVIGMMATLALATVIEVCSEGSAPMAFELFEKTKAFGNAFVFLQAGVITDYTEIGVVATNIGKRAAAALALVTIPQVLLIGFFFNRIIW